MAQQDAYNEYRQALEAAGGTWTDEDENDFQNKWNQSAEAGSYTGEDYGRGWEDIMAESERDLATRFQRPTQSNGGVGGDDDPDGDGLPGGIVRDGGSAIDSAQMREILAALQGMNSQPGVDLSGIDPGTFPSFEVPGENLSPAIDDTLLDQMGGFDPLGTQGYLRRRLEETAGGGVNSARLQSRLEGARENLTRGQTAALGDLRGTLADRGLISLPGSPQGAELDGTVRAFEPLQKAFLSEWRGAEQEESMLADEAEMDALTRATGWTSEEANRRLAAAGTAQERQAMMSDIALGVLDRNIDWNKFQATFGLEREKVMEEIRQGRIAAIMPAIQMMLALTGQSRQGYI
jgi:hypothetical protein